TAMREYDAAMRHVARVCRPWHHALILERAGLFHRAHGAQTLAEHLLAQALHGYAVWGATAKVEQLRREHPHLVTPSDADAAPSPATAAVASQQISHDAI